MSPKTREQTPPSMDDVLRRMLARPPDPKATPKPKKKAKKPTKK